MSFNIKSIARSLALATLFVAYSPALGIAKGLEYSNEEVGEREDGTGAFRTHCLETHTSYDDPIVYPGRSGASHQHVFFGNPTIDANTTAKSIHNATRTKCDGGILNRTGYWIPALYDQNGERIELEDPLFYYKTGYHVPARAIKPPPKGLRIIAGDAKSTTYQDVSVIKFRCESWKSNKVWFDPGDPLDHVPYMPDCENNDILEIRIMFPQCWDGKNLDSRDHSSHMAYPIEASPPRAGTGYCPRSHPIAIPEISYNFAIYVTPDRGSPTTWRFSSDKKLSGSSLHADWMNGWNRKIMGAIVKNCLKPARECMVGLLGNGKRLKSIVTD